MHSTVYIVRGRWGQGSCQSPLYVIEPPFQARPKNREHRNGEKRFNTLIPQFSISLIFLYTDFKDYNFKFIFLLFGTKHICLTFLHNIHSTSLLQFISNNGCFVLKGTIGDTTSAISYFGYLLQDSHGFSHMSGTQRIFLMK